MELAELVRLIADRPPSDRRYVVAIAGPPASGKSTLAAAIRDRLPDRAAVLGLDAFHFDDRVLESRGHLGRKGAHHTFDLQGYRRCLETLVAEPSEEVAIPVFDRALELSRNCADVVLPEHDIIVTEGNYLLLESGDWPSLASLFDQTIYLDVPLSTVRARILERWTHHGFSAAEALARSEQNDLPNAQLVSNSSRTADHTIKH